MSTDPFEDWPDDYGDEPDYLDDPEEPDDLDDVDAELGEFTDDDLAELYELPRKRPSDPLVGFARPCAPRRSYPDRTVVDLPAL